VRGGFDKEREGSVLLGFVELIAIVEHDQHVAFFKTPRHRLAGTEPTGTPTLLLNIANQRMEQVGLADARWPPQVDRRGLLGQAAQVGHCRRIGPGHITFE